MKKYCVVFLILFLLSGCSEAPDTATISPSPLPTPTSTAAPAPSPQPVSVSIAAVGDNLIHSPIYNQASRRAGGNGFDFTPAYQYVRSLWDGFDLTVINQETPLGGTSMGLSNYPLFNSPQELGDDLVSLGFNTIIHANNHVLDMNQEGLAATYEYWQTKPVTLLGIREKSASNVQYIRSGDITIALAAYTYGTNGRTLPSDSPYAVSYISDEMLEEIQDARSNADLVIVFLHWGNEYETTANEQQISLAKQLAKENVDAVIGHHPHVIQPIELYARPDGKNMICAYSLGNFISCQNEAATMLGGVLQLEFSGTTEDVSLETATFEPIVTHYDRNYQNVRIYPLSQYTPDLAAQHGILKYDSSFSYEFLENQLNRTISEIYRR